MPAYLNPWIPLILYPYPLPPTLHNLALIHYPSPRIPYPLPLSPTPYPPQLTPYS